MSLPGLSGTQSFTSEVRMILSSVPTSCVLRSVDKLGVMDDDERALSF